MLDKVVFPLLALVLTPIAVALGSEIATGNWMEWFGLIPNTASIVFGLVIFVWVVIITIRSRLKRLQELDAVPGIFVGSRPPFGWVTIGKFDYAGVVWRVRAAPARRHESLEPSRISSLSIEVETLPRCPNCKTELEESRSFWGGYVWRCVRLGF